MMDRDIPESYLYIIIKLLRIVTSITKKIGGENICMYKGETKES
jgi:hypothetical protein